MSGSVQKSRQVVYTRFFYKQHFYKQRQAEIGQVKLKLSSTLSPWAWTFAIWIFFFTLFIHVIIMRLKMNIRSQDMT